MPQQKQQQKFFTHQFPAWLLRHPRCIHGVYAINYLLHLRKWHITPVIRKLLRKRKEPFQVLDAGCGEGQFLFPYASQYRGSFFKGIDREQGNVLFGQAYIRNRSLDHVSIVQASIEQLQEHNSYDVILCISVLNYCKDQGDVLKSLREALKPGGELLLYVPTYYHKIFPFYKTIMERYENYESVQQATKIYSEPEMRALVAQSGLELVQAKKTYGFFGKISNELINTHFILYNAVVWPVKLLLMFSFILVYPIILLSMLADLILPVQSGNGLLMVARKP